MSTTKIPRGPRHAVEEPAQDLFLERRRPGRIENVSPELIPLLRGETIPPNGLDADRIEAEQARDVRIVWIAILTFAALFLSFRLGLWSWLT